MIEESTAWYVLGKIMTWNHRRRIMFDKPRSAHNGISCKLHQLVNLQILITVSNVRVGNLILTAFAIGFTSDFKGGYVTGILRIFGPNYPESRW